MTTPNLSLPEMPQNSFQVSPDFNAAMVIIDALLGLSPLDKDLTAPPSTVASDAGKTWIVAAGATGAWSGHAGKIALCVGANLWIFLNPKRGLIAYVDDEAIFYFYNGSAWAVFVA